MLPGGGGGGGDGSRGEGGGGGVEVSGVEVLRCVEGESSAEGRSSRSGGDCGANRARGGGTRATVVVSSLPGGGGQTRDWREVEQSVSRFGEEAIVLV